MMPILPPELTYTILESTILSAHDLTKIALTSRSLLPVARKSLYRSIQVCYESEVGYVMYVPRPHRHFDSTKNCPTTFEIFRSNPLLPTLVQKLHINNAGPYYEADNVPFLSEIIPPCTNLEVLVCTEWEWDPQQLATIVAEFKRSRSLAGRQTKLNIHLSREGAIFRGRIDPLCLPLASFQVGRLDHRFAANYLASSASSLRALDVNLKDAHLYRNFPNVTILFVHHEYHDGFESDGIGKLISTLLQFGALDTLCCRSNRLCPSIRMLSWFIQRLPSSLRSLSFDFFFSPFHVLDLADHVLDNAPLKQLNLFGPEPRNGYWEATQICRRKGVKLTIGEQWNVWDNLCTSSSLASCTRYILTCSHLE